MADTQEQPKPEISTSDKPTISFSIWPPSQRTRDAVTNRLVETLSSPSVLSKRYGTLPEAEAAATAKLIEEEAFAAASSTAASDDDGIEILQGYSKEISKRMLETVKARAGGTGEGHVAESVSEGHVAEEESVTGSN
ncbi:MFP1 attachment factor 1 [Heracleum sosnowskyi]|uniref:MFP1 attachment factor 1 n=1 Tax=Heracleum sosnowskyi TaxID=360622 RepID=A0AAD8JLL2_9APIA|nr:MFP1 attachment factor 1 [Heracleum sosnowskyi]KAK1405659.1 MFP1 attachment factor 1 [Heracleum sosnowskyi]